MKKSGVLSLDMWTKVLAILILAAGILRIFGRDNVVARLDETTLVYLAMAAAVLMLGRIKTLKIGDKLEIEMQEMKSQIEELTLKSGIAEDSAKLVAPTATPSFDLREKTATIQPGKEPDDPWKGVFGGKNISKAPGRVLTADVVELASSPGWYAILLSVKSLPGESPLVGQVQFFIHPTFPNNKPIVDAVRGEAVLRLRAWGAFTVGALTDKGNTRLELDLAQLQGVPIEFRNR